MSSSSFRFAASLFRDLQEVYFVEDSSNGRCFFGAGALIPIGRKRRFGDFLADGNRGGNKGVVEAPTIAGDIVSVGSLDGVCCLSVISGILPNCNGFAEDNPLTQENNFGRECHHAFFAHNLRFVCIVPDPWILASSQL